MKVDDVYTRNAVVVGPDTSAPEARQLMAEHDVRRLPVVEDGKLVGIVTQTDLLKAAPSPATSLSIWELNYLLDKIKVAELMTREVVTTTPDTELQTVAKIMAERKIGGMPVVEGDRVVGIITESDVFPRPGEAAGRQAGLTHRPGTSAPSRLRLRGAGSRRPGAGMGAPPRWRDVERHDF